MKKELTLDALARGPQVDRWLAAAVLAFAAATTVACSREGTGDDEGGTSADAVTTGGSCVDVESSDVSLKDAPSGGSSSGWTTGDARQDDEPRGDAPLGGVTRCRDRSDDQRRGDAPIATPPKGSSSSSSGGSRGDAPSGGWW